MRVPDFRSRLFFHRAEVKQKYLETFANHSASSAQLTHWFSASFSHPVMADGEAAPMVEAPRPTKKRSPNRLVVEEAMNDDNSVPWVFVMA